MNLVWADRLRNLATFLVIAIHVAAPVAEEWRPLDTWQWWSGNFWNSLSRPGVPLFVMLSGFLLLGKDYETGSFIKKRFVRVLVPALFWMLVYCLYGYLAKGSPGNWWEVFKSIFEGPVHYHLWFVYLILGLYLFYPILRPWVRQASEGDFMFLFLLCALGSWGYKLVYTFFGLEFGLNWEFFTNNLGYFVLGYYLGEKKISGEGTPNSLKTNDLLKKWPLSKSQMRALSIGLIVFGTASTMLGAYWAKSSQDVSTHRYFYDYLTPNVGLAAIGWFLFARFFFSGKKMFDIEIAFAEASFGIYLTHVLVMDWWAQCGFWHSGVNPVRGLPLLMCMVFLMTFNAVMLIRVLPFGKKIT